MSLCCFKLEPLYWIMYVLKERMIASSTRFSENQFSTSGVLASMESEILKGGVRKEPRKAQTKKETTWHEKVLTTGVHFGEHGISDPPRSPNTDRSEFWASWHHVISLQMGGLCASIAHIMKPHSYCRAHSKACSFHRHYIL